MGPLHVCIFVLPAVQYYDLYRIDLHVTRKTWIPGDPRMYEFAWCISGSRMLTLAYRTGTSPTLIYFADVNTKHPDAVIYSVLWEEIQTRQVWIGLPTSLYCRCIDCDV